MRNSKYSPLLPDEITRILMGSGANSPALDRLSRNALSMQALEWRILQRKKQAPGISPVTVRDLE